MLVHDPRPDANLDERFGEIERLIDYEIDWPMRLPDVPGDRNFGSSGFGVGVNWIK